MGSWIQNRARIIRRDAEKAAGLKFYESTKYLECHNSNNSGIIHTSSNLPGIDSNSYPIKFKDNSSCQELQNIMTTYYNYDYLREDCPDTDPDKIKEFDNYTRPSKI